MNELITVSGVRGRLDIEGNAELNLEDVARGLGFTQTQSKGGKEYISVRWERISDYLTSFSFPHKWGKEWRELTPAQWRDVFIPENIFYKLCFKAESQTACVRCAGGRVIWWGFRFP